MRRTSGFVILLFLGIIIVGVGLFMGISSHQVTYQTVGEQEIAHYLSDSENSTGYLQMTGSPALYYVPENEFTPMINGINTLKNGYVISFVYEPSDTKSIDITSTIGTHLQGTGAKVVHITLTTDAGKQNFDTDAYSKNPQGYYQNNWTTGGGLAAVGLLLAVVSFFLPKTRKVQQSFSIDPQTGAYQQPYPGQYPPAQPGAYPPAQPGAYPPAQPGAYPPPPQRGYPYQEPHS